MENGSLDRYGSVKTALELAGFKVDKVEKQVKKTVITVSRCGQSSREQCDNAPAVPEEQEENKL